MKLTRKQRIVGSLIFVPIAPFALLWNTIAFICGSLSMILDSIHNTIWRFDRWVGSKYVKLVRSL